MEVPDLSRSPSTSRSPSRPSTPNQELIRNPPTVTASPSRSPRCRSPEKVSYLGHEAQDAVQKIAGDYLLSGADYGLPKKVPDSVLPSNVASDSSSVAALDSQLNHEDLKQELTPSSAGLDARVSLEQTAEAAKYGVHTKSASDGADVRWYFCKTPLRPNEAAAQVPASEVVGKGDYFRFSVRDSLALEAAFVQREEELVSAWWKEYAEVSAGPARSSGLLLNCSQHQKDVEEEMQRSLRSASNGGKNHNGPGSSHSDFDDEESVGVLVKGGLYEVDLMLRRCIPVYWRGEHRRVLRGHWYGRKGGLDWFPLREDVSEQLEIAYHKKIWRRRAFQPSGLYAARVNLTGTTLGLHALFTGEDDTWEAVLAVDVSGISAILGLQGSAVKLRRGFAPPDSVHPTQDELRQRKEEELDDYASQVPVRHVVFMVHGIGQRLEKANLVDDVGAFRQSVTALSEHHLTPHQRNAQRILFIPCQWRRELKLGGEVAMEQVTLDGVRALRTMITATVHDVLYYMSPVYCQDIIDSVTRSLNRLYTKFIKRNPTFDGKVSLYGHSLGSVLTYDILCHQDTLKSAFPVQNVNAAITRNDESEDEMPKIDRLPSVIESELIPESETSVQDVLGSADPPVITLADTSTNETVPECAEEAVQENDPIEIENLAPESSSTEAFAMSEKDNEVFVDGESAWEGTDVSENYNTPVGNRDAVELDKKTHEEVSEVQNAENESGDAEEDVSFTEAEISQDLESAQNEEVKDDKDESGAVSTLEPQAIEQSALEGLAATEIERARVLVDEVIEESAVQFREMSEVDILKAEVAVLQDKLRLLESNQVSGRTGETNSDVRGGTLDRFDSTNGKTPQDSVGSAESSRSHIYNGQDGQELGQSTSDHELGYVQGNVEASVSARKQHRPFIIYPKLKFKVDTFYAVGSPLGMFLALRNIRIGLGTGTEYWQDEGIDEEMPACRLLLNIFHPYDPVAYRLEPLVCKEYVNLRPVFIPYHKGGKRLHIGYQEFREDLSIKTKAFVSSIGAVGTQVAQAFSTRKEDTSTEEENERSKLKSKTYGEMVMERLTGSSGGRIDCMLQDSTFEHPYISAISSHTSYWQDPDTALFILKHLYRDIPEEPEVDNVPTMEALHGMIDDNNNEIRKPESPSSVPPASREQDGWDSGDDDSTSYSFSKEDFVAALSDDMERAQAKYASHQKL